MTTSNFRAVVIGGGAIGTALADQLANDKHCEGIVVTHRTPSKQSSSGKITQLELNLESEASIESCFASIAQQWPCIEKIYICSGMLHEGVIRPEKSLTQLTSAHMTHSWLVNAVGPLLVAKHAEPLLKKSRGQSIFAALSARVGSISDNRLGGWYGYRMAKAALNMGVKNLAIEWQRKRMNTICVALHPGTTDSPLSAPFQANVDSDKLFSPAYTASHLLRLSSQLTQSHTGKFFAWDGSELPW
ncbi:SDR family oxidoreductase [Corallincola luteus]|uniref:SDR family oxidoreductase n=1 Tax=Corallincola luteus TaxID=1775177 RepID=A0ABY2ASU4_9GAMM|nr:SDR family oxidoreductase [Corallincola luteus]TCI05182.1 SDR family oxidoreductase [Corallincola luteus]